MLSARVMSVTDLSEGDRRVWDGLCRTQPVFRSPFLTPQFSEAAASALGRRVRVKVIYRDGEPVAFLPFQHKEGWQGALGICERVAGELSDYFGPVFAKDLDLTQEQVVASPGPPVLYFSHLDHALALAGFGGRAPEVGLKILLPEDGTSHGEHFKALNKKAFGNLQRCRRNLARDHGELSFAFQSSAPAERLDHVISVKRERYGETGVTDVLAEPRTRQFLHRLLGGNEPSCAPVLSELFAGDTWVASHFGLRCHDVLHYWFPVYNQDLRRYAPGQLLLAEILEAAPSEGITVVDRGEGVTEAKSAFATYCHLFHRDVWVAPTLRGAVARRALSLAWRLRL